MSFKQIVAIVRQSKIKALTDKLYENDISGVSIVTIQGYGQHVNTYAKNIMESSTRIEIFAPLKDVKKITEIIKATASTGLIGDGLIAVMPVDAISHLHNLDTPAP